MTRRPLKTRKMVGFGFIAGVIAMLLVLFVATNVVITARQALATPKF